MIVLFIGSLMVVGNMAIQIYVLVFVIKLLSRRTEGLFGANHSLLYQTCTLSIVVFWLFLGHVMQFAIWAMLFVYIGQFQDFETAFYHSAVNFTSLGYGDIVMDAPWRLLGGLEAANGVLMFGLSAGAILSIMQWMLRNDPTDLVSGGGHKGRQDGSD